MTVEEQDEVTKEEFDDALEELLDDMNGAQLLAIPGLYEVVSEQLNNEIIDKAKGNR